MLEGAFDDSIDKFSLVVFEAASDILDDAGEEILEDARDNVEWGYTKPELGWRPPDPLTIWIHQALGHIPANRPELHTGLLHLEYKGDTPNLFDSLKRGRPNNIFEPLLDGDGNPSIKVGSNFMAAARHEYGIGYAHPPKGFEGLFPSGMSGGGGEIPARPFMKPARDGFFLEEVDTGNVAAKFANRIRMGL